MAANAGTMYNIFILDQFASVRLSKPISQRRLRSRGEEAYLRGEENNTFVFFGVEFFGGKKVIYHFHLPVN